MANQSRLLPDRRARTVGSPQAPGAAASPLRTSRIETSSGPRLQKAPPILGEGDRSYCGCPSLASADSAVQNAPGTPGRHGQDRVLVCCEPDGVPGQPVSLFT